MQVSNPIPRIVLCTASVVVKHHWQTSFRCQNPALAQIEVDKEINFKHFFPTTTTQNRCSWFNHWDPGKQRQLQKIPPQPPQLGLGIAA